MVSFKQTKTKMVYPWFLFIHGFVYTLCQRRADEDGYGRVGKGGDDRRRGGGGAAGGAQAVASGVGVIVVLALLKIHPL
jgi:hypothetical protein